MQLPGSEGLKSPGKQRAGIIHDRIGVLHLRVTHDAPWFVIGHALTMIAGERAVASRVMMDPFEVVHGPSRLSPFGGLAQKLDGRCRDCGPTSLARFSEILWKNLRH